MPDNQWTSTVTDAIGYIDSAKIILRQARIACPDHAAKVYLADYIGALSRTISGLRELAEGENQ